MAKNNKQTTPFPAVRDSTAGDVLKQTTNNRTRKEMIKVTMSREQFHAMIQAIMDSCDSKKEEKQEEKKK